MEKNPYMVGLKMVRENIGTSGQIALAKCILSLYNSDHAFSISEIVSPLDFKYTGIVVAMLSAYIKKGETEELRIAGKWVYDHFPHLVELSNAMTEARGSVRLKWDRHHEEKRGLYQDA